MEVGTAKGDLKPFCFAGKVWDGVNALVDVE
jgi:hypothetical protein